MFAGTVTLGPNARIGGRPEGSGFRSQGRFGAGWVWSIGLAALAALLAGALPGAARRIAATSRERWGRALLLGFVVLVCVPVAALALMFTLIGIPLVLGTIAAFPGLLLVGYVSTGVVLAMLLGIGLIGWAAYGARLAPTPVVS